MIPMKIIHFVGEDPQFFGSWMLGNFQQRPPRKMPIQFSSSMLEFNIKHSPLGKQRRIHCEPEGWMTSGAETPESASNPEQEFERHETSITKEVLSVESTP